MKMFCRALSLISKPNTNPAIHINRSPKQYPHRFTLCNLKTCILKTALIQYTETSIKIYTYSFYFKKIVMFYIIFVYNVVVCSFTSFNI